MARLVEMSLPRTLVFGPACAVRSVEASDAAWLQRALIATSPATRDHCRPLERAIGARGGTATVFSQVQNEPTFDLLEVALSAVRDARATCVIGLGGGSVMDLAKLMAALPDQDRPAREYVGTGRLPGRPLPLILLPTTAGTGSEVSPNAILLDEVDHLKKAIISPHLVPDAAYVDPELTFSVPPAITSATGLDALTHCIEAYVNRTAHPMIDPLALEGVRLIASGLCQACRNPRDAEARGLLALGSMFGGMCLGPVNTAAVHALAYPLGGEFGIAHGLSNALLLPHVLAFNLSAAPERYAAVAVALGAEPGKDATETAQRGIQRVNQLLRDCGIDGGLSAHGVPTDAIEQMVASAMTVSRLLDRNVRPVDAEAARQIYRRAM